MELTKEKNGFRITVRDITYIGVFAAIIVVMAQLSIPMPAGVPMTMQTFAITLAAVVLGAKLSTFASLVYILLGAIGLPVLANFTGGFEKFIGPTGGFLLSFPIMAFIIGLGVDYGKKFGFIYLIALVLGTVMNYVVGLAMFCALTGGTVMAGLTACVIPYIPTAIIKAVLATVIGFQIRKRLIAAGLL